MKVDNIKITSWKYQIQDMISKKYVSSKLDLTVGQNSFNQKISSICFQKDIGDEYNNFDEVSDIYNYIKAHQNEIQIIDGDIENINNLQIVKVKKLQPVQHKLIKINMFQQMLYQDWIESITDFFNEL